MGTIPHQGSHAAALTSEPAEKSSFQDIVEVRSFIAEWRTQPQTGSSPSLIDLSRGELSREVHSADRTLRVAFSPRLTTQQAPSLDGDPESILLSLGDAWEWNGERPPSAMGNAATVDFRAKTKSLAITTSITGMPPVYVWQGVGRTIVTSDLYLLASTLGSALSFDPDGVADLCSYGYPVDYRTLFQNTRLCPAATRLTMRPDGTLSEERCWSFPAESPMRSWEEFTELRASSFVDVLRHMDLQHTFLSLTAGLDTRTILAVLANEGRNIPGYTMTGANWTVDARAAHALSQAYGIPHEIVPLGPDFLRSLPDLTREASRRSGGVASLEQSHDVYLYRFVGSRFSARLSGNMGNQLGRTGVEHVSMRSADSSFLNGDLQARTRERARAPWYEKGLRTKAVYEFLLQQEVPFTLAGNFSIGHYFAVQQSPYASRKLFELCPLRPVDGRSAAPPSSLHLRLNDMRHRFLGEPAERSFQRHLICQMGGVAASYPINWGWRAKGGVSLGGSARGFLSLVDALAVRQQFDSGLPGAVLDGLHIAGLHEYRNWKLWLRTVLRDFVRDTLSSSAIQQSSIFDGKVLAKMVEEHYGEKVNHHRALVLALDLALAVEEFGASSR